MLRAILELWEINGQAEFNEQTFAHTEQKIYHALLSAYHDLVDGFAIELRNAMTVMTEECPEVTRDVLGPLRVEILDLLNEIEGEISVSR